MGAVRICACWHLRGGSIAAAVATANYWRTTPVQVRVPRQGIFISSGGISLGWAGISWTPANSCEQHLWLQLQTLRATPWMSLSVRMAIASSTVWHVMECPTAKTSQMRSKPTVVSVWRSVRECVCVFGSDVHYTVRSKYPHNKNLLFWCCEDHVFSHNKGKFSCIKICDYNQKAKKIPKDLYFVWLLTVKVIDG